MVAALFVLIMVAIYSVPVMVAVGVIFAKRARFRRARDELALLPGVRAFGNGAQDEMTFAEGERTVRFWPFDKNSQLWRFEADEVPLGRRCSISGATRQHFLPPAPDGMWLVTVGIQAVDSRFNFWSTDPDIAQAALCEPSISEPLSRLGDVSRHLRLDLDGTGLLKVTFTGIESATAVADGYFRTFHALAAAMDATERARSLPPARFSGSGGASGAPISVSLTNER